MNNIYRALSNTASNFANVNSNGNANYNNASNSNGVRPDFDTANEKAFDRIAVEKGEGVLPYGKY